MDYIKISAYCKTFDISEKEAIRRIRNGELKGKSSLGSWYVVVEDTSHFGDTDILKTSAKTELKTDPVKSTLKPQRNFQTPKQKVKLSTLDYVSGKEIEELELITVSSVQSLNIFKQFGAEMRSQTVGGKSSSMSKLMQDMREDLLKELQDRAHRKRADAVIGIHFTSGEVLQNGLELMVYGTAVKIIR